MVLPCKETLGILDPEQFPLSSRYSHGMTPFDATAESQRIERKHTQRKREDCSVSRNPRDRELSRINYYSHLYMADRALRACWVAHGDGDTYAGRRDGGEHVGNQRPLFCLIGRLR